MVIITIMLKYARNAIIHGKENFNVLKIFSLTCDDGTSNDCLTCNTTAINHRNDNSSIH